MTPTAQTALAILVGLGACKGPAQSSGPIDDSAHWLGSGGLDIVSASLTPNLLVVELRLDGVLAHRHTAAGPADVVIETRFVSKSLASGQHTMTLRVANQVASPHDYDVLGGVSFMRSDGTQGETSAAGCQPVRRRLATGDEVSCSFILP
jgi:hypothetical protein